ncbi:hypothetical protein HF521_016923 [Silurus meridionalis]|uniref:Uncharacterized protein n=1 Tax=Silurus meridionalis TaxID=175797 RepID=A0A8T0BR40_SILME|nr:hypothetical protein HF521_016923 [Silurus meridionalis]
MVVPRNLNDSTAAIVLFMMVEKQKVEEQKLRSRRWRIKKNRLKSFGLLETLENTVTLLLRNLDCTVDDGPVGSIPEIWDCPHCTGHDGERTLKRLRVCDVFIS